MEVCGLDILESPNARKLFELGKAWISATWRAKERNITKIEILPKAIGRNEGFIVEIYISNPCEAVRYFAKIQSPHVDTVMTHYLLKYTNCGPDEFFIALLDPAVRYGWYVCQEHGVITRNIPSWRMASSWTEEEERELGVLLVRESFLLTFLISLGRFGNIPGNRDNWGLVDKSGNELDTSRLKLVDFSSCGTISGLPSLDSFYNAWTKTFLTCRTPYGYYLNNAWKNAAKELIIKESVSQYARQVPWLYSPDAFVALLLRVCDDTEAWLLSTIEDCMEPRNDNTKSGSKNDDVVDAAEGAIGVEAAAAQLNSVHIGSTQPAPPAPVGPTEGSSAENIDGNKPTSESTVPPILLQAFRDTPRPNTRHCSSTLVEMVREYVQWVEMWNLEVTGFCKWFPFPATVDAQQQQQAGRVEKKGEERLEEEGKGESAVMGPTEHVPVRPESEGEAQKVIGTVDGKA